MLVDVGTEEERRMEVASLGLYVILRGVCEDFKKLDACVEAQSWCERIDDIQVAAGSLTSLLW